eukprot:1295414-Amphidinium_carterae.1
MATSAIGTLSPLRPLECLWPLQPVERHGHFGHCNEAEVNCLFIRRSTLFHSQQMKSISSSVRNSGKVSASQLASKAFFTSQ